MSEQMTTIKVFGADGIMRYGKKTRAEMIAEYRAVAEKDLSMASAVLNANDGDFVVEQHTGKCVRRNIVKINE